MINNFPYLWISFFITIVLVLLAIKIKNQKAKIIISNLIAIPLAIFIGEIVCGILNYSANNTTDFTKIITEEIRSNKAFYTTDDIGYALSKNVKTTAYEKYRNKILYDVTYTTDQNGLRITPSSDENSNKCILVFGCSYNFGVGINDNETLPYFLGMKTNNKYRIYNFGIPGYGPHQMLREIEQGYPNKVMKGCKESIAIYDGMYDHILRLSGRKSWDPHGPKYSLVNGEPVYQGHFDDKKSIFAGLKPLLAKSEIYKFLDNYNNTRKAYLNKKEEDYYCKLYIAVLKKSKKLLREKYNIKRFITVFWPCSMGKRVFNSHWACDYKGCEKIMEYLKENSLEYYSETEILPDYSFDLYHIQYDGHPNKLANEKIAEFLAKRIDN